MMLITRRTISKWCTGVVLVFIALWGMSRCYSREILLHDCYYISHNLEFGEGFFLNCNPGYLLRDGITQLDNLKSAAWNSRIIIVEQQSPRTETPNVWYIIPAAGEELRCGNDTLIGPLTVAEKDAWLGAHPPVGRLKKQTF